MHTLELNVNQRYHSGPSVCCCWPCTLALSRGPAPYVTLHVGPQVLTADGKRLLHCCTFTEELDNGHDVSLMNFLVMVMHDLNQDTIRNSSNTTTMAVIHSDGRTDKVPSIPTETVRGKYHAGAHSWPRVPEAAPEPGIRNSCCCYRSSPHLHYIWLMQHPQRSCIEMTIYLQDCRFSYYAVFRDS